jgi:hypothetical protein
LSQTVWRIVTDSSTQDALNPAMPGNNFSERDPAAVKKHHIDLARQSRRAFPERSMMTQLNETLADALQKMRNAVISEIVSSWDPRLPMSVSFEEFADIAGQDLATEPTFITAILGENGSIMLADAGLSLDDEGVALGCIFSSALRDAYRNVPWLFPRTGERLFPPAVAPTHRNERGDRLQIIGPSSESGEVWVFWESGQAGQFNPIGLTPLADA